MEKELRIRCIVYAFLSGKQYRYCLRKDRAGNFAHPLHLASLRGVTQRQMSWKCNRRMGMHAPGIFLWPYVPPPFPVHPCSLSFVSALRRPLAGAVSWLSSLPAPRVVPAVLPCHGALAIARVAFVLPLVHAAVRPANVPSPCSSFPRNWPEYVRPSRHVYFPLPVMARFWNSPE